MIKRILLINVPDTRPQSFQVRLGLVPPLGLASLAAVLLDAGFEVEVLDALAGGTGSWEKDQYDSQIRYGLSDAAIMWEIEQFNPDMVGVTCPFSARHWDTLNVCRIAKVVDPEIVTVVGGPHPTAIPGKVLEDHNIDYVVLGEGENTLRELIWRLNGKGNLAEVDGLAYRTGNKHWRMSITPRSRFIMDLDRLPIPARHLLPMDKYINSDSPHCGYRYKPYTAISTSRGCPNKCTYCVIRQLWGLRIRYRSAENVLAEIDHLIAEYGIRELHFEDDNLTANHARTMRLLQGIIDRSYNLALAAPSGLAVGTLTPHTLWAMRDAGFYTVSVAIESGVPRVLKLMRKPVDLDKAKAVVADARALGMYVRAFFMLGYPGETKEDMQRTIDFAASLDVDWAHFFITTPIPGSELEALCREKGYLADPHMPYLQQFYQANIKTEEFGPGDIEMAKELADELVNFKGNTNMRLGNYDRAIADFEAVLRHYPDLGMAKEALEYARKQKEDDNRST